MGNKQTKSSGESTRPASAPAATRRKVTTTVSDPTGSSRTADGKKPERKTSAQPTRGSRKTENSSSETENEVLKEIKNIKHNKLLTAAIDFGTTYSGYAYMTKAEYLENNGDSAKIHCPSWIRDGGMSYKAPTSVLFRPNKKFHSFGYEAEKYYHENSDNQDFKEWFFFKHFKMKLYTDKSILSKDTEIEDSRECGNRMKAVDVFAAVIKYFKDHLLGKTETQNRGSITNDDIHWVITVPAIWDLKAKTFMKDAAEKAGILQEQLTLALEPEAASLYCRKIPVSVETTKAGRKNIAAMMKGSRYIVFDQGGGTTDITVHEVTGPDTLIEIHQACGGHYGGNTVNAKFFSFLTRVFSGPVIHEIKNKHPSEYFDLMGAFELKKVAFTESETDAKGMVTLRVPFVWIEIYKKHTEESLAESLEGGPFKDQVIVRNDKLRISNKIFRSFFDYSIENVLEVFSDLFKKPEIRNIDTLLAVGGYSESSVLINAIKRKFPHLNIIVPKDPVVAVLKGAILYGFEPNCITERVSQYTYGVAMQLPFDPDKHERSKIGPAKDRRGRQMVDDIFDKHVEIGQVSKIGEFEAEHDYYPLINQNMVHLEFFASDAKDPKYTTDDSCQAIGVLSFELLKQGKILLKLNASGTEVIAVVREDETGQERRAYFNLM